MAKEEAPVSYDELLAENRRLRLQVKELSAEIEKLRAPIEELHWSNHRPHAPFPKGPPKADPKPPGRKPGDAYGRHAHREPPARMDEVYDAPLPAACPDCGGAVCCDALREQFRTEVPRRPIQRKFRVQCRHCQDCGRRGQWAARTTQRPASWGSSRVVKSLDGHTGSIREEGRPRAPWSTRGDSASSRRTPKPRSQ